MIKTLLVAADFTVELPGGDEVLVVFRGPRRPNAMGGKRKTKH